MTRPTSLACLSLALMFGGAAPVIAQDIPATETATATAPAPAPAPATDGYLQRLPEDEVIYFVLPDRFENGDTSNDHGGLKGGPLKTGFNPER